MRRMQPRIIEASSGGPLALAARASETRSPNGSDPLSLLGASPAPQKMIQSAFASTRGAADTRHGNCVIGRPIDGAPRRTAAPAETNVSAHRRNASEPRAHAVFPRRRAGRLVASRPAPYYSDADDAPGPTMTSGWVLRKVKQNDKWVRRWLEVNRHVLYSYQACPAESPQARVINMLDLRKTREIKLVDGGVAGLFCIVPVSADGQHPGYLMRADTAANAQEWVTGLNKVRAIELEKSPVESEGRQPEETVCCCIRRRRPAEATRLVN